MTRARRRKLERIKNRGFEIHSLPVLGRAHHSEVVKDMKRDRRKARKINREKLELHAKNYSMGKTKIELTYDELMKGDSISANPK